MDQDTTGRLEAEGGSSQLSPAWSSRALARQKLQIISYGHSNGPLQIPSGTEHLNFSVRDIENPPVRLRRTHTGLSARLRKEVMAGSYAKERLANICTIVNDRMAKMINEDNSNALVVGIMCEEGKHRSVAFAEELSRQIESRDWDIDVQHRDLGIVGNEDPGEMKTLHLDRPNLPSAKNFNSIGRKGKKQRDQERTQGRLSAQKFVGGYSEDHEDGG
ncbi:hypothetical protein LTR84_012034 [Exophiala bonariae]|uniref:RapZ C-terminal domain-containing protein n=1 Tax=Exophiala bonariae TaxID=1690606 RepID=A0AAV9NFD5_9EURO|nr:hypothetical protein LTR84_012034 [Exophiala bonariae]